MSDDRRRTVEVTFRDPHLTPVTFQDVKRKAVEKLLEDARESGWVCFEGPDGDTYLWPREVVACVRVREHAEHLITPAT
ncbi:hypothetical protein [Deinococcus pimensis]|uniref:hypothetical protein n=1 Tax=Deinococcus pimensis TaxID=309888 RepID=UPI0004825904|nr:hypothetical protein [Deinococcus pimensis]